MDLTKEYESLREEIFEWQRRRFTILSLTITFVTAYLTYLHSSIFPFSKPIAISIPFIFIGSAVLITSLFGRFITMIGTYLEIYYSDYSWNVRIPKFKKRFWYLELNYGFAIIYFTIALFALIIILSTNSKIDETCCHWIILLFTSIFLLSSFLTIFIYPRKTYREVWEVLRKEESSKIHEEA